MATRQGVVGVRARSRAPAQVLGRGHPAVLLSVSVGALLLLGLVMILSASSVTSFATYDSSFFFFKRQLICAVIGTGAFIFFARLDYRKLAGSGYLLFAGTCALLVAVLIPGLGITVGGSARWLGWGPLSFQPSEMAKLAFVLFAADVFSRKDEKLLEGFSHTVLPLMPAMGLLVLLIMKQPDMGTTLVTGAIGLSMLFVAGAPLRFLLPIGVFGVAAATFGALAAPYRQRPAACVHGSLGRPAVHGISNDPVVDRAGLGRMVRGGPGGESPEMDVHTECAYGLHLRHLGRGDRSVWAHSWCLDSSLS